MTVCVEQLHLPRQVVTKIFHHAQEESDAVGLILSNERSYHCQRLQKNTFLDLSNIDSNSVDENFVTCSVFESEEVFGIYAASETDAIDFLRWETLMAHYQTNLLFVVALGMKGVMELRAFRLSDRVGKNIELILDVM